MAPPLNDLYEYFRQEPRPIVPFYSGLRQEVYSLHPVCGLSLDLLKVLYSLKLTRSQT